MAHPNRRLLLSLVVITSVALIWHTVLRGAIDPGWLGAGGEPLTEITALGLPWIFVDTPEELDEAHTAYGLAVTQTDPNGKQAFGRGDVRSARGVRPASCEFDFSRDPGLGSPYLTADVEGLTIYKAGSGTGYLLVSSQGSDEFLVVRWAAVAHAMGLTIDSTDRVRKHKQ